MQLNLKKPIIFFDLETTGIDIMHDRIVEISMIKVLPSGEEIEKTRRVNPGIPIPAEATAVHHITDADVANEPMFRQIARSLANEMTGCDIAGFGIAGVTARKHLAQTAHTNMRVQFRGREIAVAQQKLHGAQIRSAFE